MLKYCGESGAESTGVRAEKQVAKLIADYGIEVLPVTIVGEKVIAGRLPATAEMEDHRKLTLRDAVHCS